MLCKSGQMVNMEKLFGKYFLWSKDNIGIKVKKNLSYSSSFTCSHSVLFFTFCCNFFIYVTE